MRFLSCEPLLDDLDLRGLLDHCPEHDGPGFFCMQRRHPGVQRISWVIVGGESGSGARRMDLEWARVTVAQCREAGVACFVKQLGARYGSPDDPKLCDTADARIGLLHDATEAYLGDVISPLKCQPGMEMYREIETKMSQAVAIRFGLPSMETPSVELADRLAVFLEMRDLMRGTPTKVWPEVARPI